MYQPRIYRDEMNSDRFRLFSSVHLESDLLVGVSHRNYFLELETACRKEQVYLYKLLAGHIAANPSFATSLSPLQIPAEQNISAELECMYECACATGTGPMSSVAGLFAEFVGRAIGSMTSSNLELGKSTTEDSGEDFRKDFGEDSGKNFGEDSGEDFGEDSGEDTDEVPAEIMVENGGDLYVRNRKEMVAVVHAGKVALSGSLGLVIPPGEWGVCTSSGTQGHSFSKGKADAVTIVSRSTPLADAWATALANDVEDAGDIEALLEKVADIPEIMACVIIAGGKMGIRGAFETKILS